MDNKPENSADTRTRIQARKELHERKEAERKAAAEQLQTEYNGVKDSPAVQDILAKARAFAAYHNQLAVDGVGTRVVGNDENGNPKLEDFHLSDSQTMRELGAASGLRQIIVYLESKLGVEKPTK